MWNTNKTLSLFLKHLSKRTPEVYGAKKHERGVALLILIVVLAAVLSIGINMTQTVLAELRLAREIEYSFRANFAGDQGLERTFYRDRVLRECTTPSNCEGLVNITLSDGTQSCYQIAMTKAAKTSIESRGFYRCDGTSQLKVQRTWEATY